MTLKITRLHDMARRAKSVTNERADWEAAQLGLASLDELINTYLESVDVFSRYETDADTLGKKAKKSKAAAEPPATSLAPDPAAPIPAAVFAHGLAQDPGPHRITDDEDVVYVAQAVFPHPGRSAGNNYEGPGVQFDVLFRGEPGGRPLFAHYKAADDTPPYGALIQLLAASSMMATPRQMARLQAAYPDGFEQPPALPMDLALIFNRNGRTKNPIYAKNWDDSLAIVRTIGDQLVKSRQVSRYIRQIRLLRVDWREGRLVFTEFS
jgi:hypothetical protein